MIVVRLARASPTRVCQTLQKLRLSVFLAGVVALLTTGPSRAETLRDALQHAFQRNPTLNAQRAGALATAENLPRAQSGFLPKANAFGDLGLSKQFIGLSDDTRSTLATAPRGVGVQVDQNLFDGFRTTNSVHQAKAQIASSRALLLDAEQNTLYAAVVAYMDVLTDRAVLEHIRANVAALSEQLRHTRARHDLATSPKRTSPKWRRDLRLRRPKPAS